MARAVQLLSARAAIIGGKGDIMQWKKVPLIAQWAPREDVSGSSEAAGAAANMFVSIGGCVEQLQCDWKTSSLQCLSVYNWASWQMTKVLSMMRLFMHG